MVIASKIKMAYCCMLQSQESHSKAKTSIDWPILMSVAIFTIQIGRQLNEVLYFCFEALPQETRGKRTIRDIANCFCGWKGGTINI